MEYKAIDDDSLIESTVNDIIACLKESESVLDSKSQKLTIALSGGSSPQALYPVLSQKMPVYIAQRLVLIQVDERVVDATNKDNNSNLIILTMKDLFSKGSTFFPVPVSLKEPENIARKYNDMLIELFKSTPKIHKTIAFLGAGTDGHTASIFPDQEERAMTDAEVFCTTHKKNGYFRVSLSYRSLFSFSKVIMYVPGKNKKDIVEKINNAQNSSQYPAAKVLHAHMNSLLISSK